MSLKPSTIERAYQLARSGKVAKVETIKAILKREGYNSAQIIGPLLHRQLRLALYDAKRSAGPPASMKDYILFAASFVGALSFVALHFV